MRLQGKKALVTGASRGIGQAIALAYAREGADLAVAARNVDALRDVTEKARALKVAVYSMAWDVADVSLADARLAEARNALGGLDIVVNNAGVVRLATDHPAPTPEAAYDYVMDINLKALYFVCEAAARMMQSQKSGIIINLASDAGMRAAPNAYGISKWGVIGYTAGLSKRVAKDGVRVNGIAPGPVATQMMGCEDGVPKESAGLPLGRYALPEEVADVAVFLASHDARAVHGHTIPLNTGNS
jgi:3-oxoacyl-[acyl-carrier protein] reductase